MNNALADFELAEAQVEHKEPITVGIFLLHFANLPMLELCNNFIANFCDVKKFEDSKTDTESLYLALSKKELKDSIRLEMKSEWKRLQLKDCTDSFTADAVGFFPLIVLWITQKPDKLEPVPFNQECGCLEVLCHCSKSCCCYDTTSNKLKFSSKGLHKQIMEQSGDGYRETYLKILHETVNITSTNRSFRTKVHTG